MTRFCSIFLLLLMALSCRELLAQATEEPEKTVIIVTGTWSPLPLEESHRQLDVREVREQSLIANTPIDFLQLDPSLDLRQRGPNGVLGGLSIRGGSFSQTLVLYDGFRVNDAQTAHFNLDVPMTAESVERLEILKGSGSTLYGADAVGGVVNILPATPARTEFRLRTALGSFGTNQQRVSAAYAKNGFSQHLTAYRDFSTGFIPNRDYRNLSLTSTTYLDTELGASRLYLSHADKPFGAQNFYCLCNSWERTKSWFAGGRHKFQSDTVASFGYRRHTDLFVLYRDRPGQFTNRHALESWQTAIRQSVRVGRNANMHYGAEGYRDSIASSNLGNRERSRGALYTSMDWRALSRFSLTLGAREEFFGGGRAEFLPSVGAGVWLAPKWKLAGSASRAFRLPTFTELYYRDPFSRGNSSLRPEEAWGYEGSVEFYPVAGWRASATVFRRDERNVIDWVKSALPDPANAVNIQDLQFTGVEAAVATRAGAHLLEFRYTGLHGVQDALDGLIARYTFNYPSHAGIVHWTARLPKDFLARTRMGVVQRRGQGTYTVVDAYGAWSAHRLRPFVQLTNMLDTDYQEIAGVPMPGVSVLGGLELVLGRGW